MPVHDRSSFENLYAGQPRWEIGRPQTALLAVADRITGAVLDAGCGTGENALFFAGRGQTVTGIDFLAEPITIAKRKAAERGLTATFLVTDALTLKELPGVFDSAIDSGLFHVFGDEDRRRRYVEGLASVLTPGGRLFLLCFSDQEPGRRGHGGYPAERSRMPSHGIGWWRASSRPGTRSGPIRTTPVSPTAGRGRGSWWRSGRGEARRSRRTYSGSSRTWAGEIWRVVWKRVEGTFRRTDLSKNLSKPIYPRICPTRLSSQPLAISAFMAIF